MRTESASNAHEAGKVADSVATRLETARENPLKLAPMSEQHAQELVDSVRRGRA